ncbi:hypothetical protein N0G65_000128 [Providencia rettgeri]|nr:hypothetical protein [Providencia rettgeri]
MTVSTEISSNEYTGNGVTTDFDYKFRIFKENQLSVITSDADGDNVVTLRLGTDYTVTGANKSAGGKVILTRPLANGHKISIARDIPITQETSFRNQSMFFAETHEDAFDYLTMLMQRLWGNLGLFLKRPSILANWFDAKSYRIANLGKPKRDSDAVDLGTLKDEVEGVNSTILKKEKRTLRVDDMEIAALPKASDRAGNVLTFDKNGSPVAVAPASGSAIDVLNTLAKNNGAKLIGHGHTSVSEFLDEITDGILVTNIIENLSVDNRNVIYAANSNIYIPKDLSVRCNLHPDDDVTIFKGEGKILTRDPWGNEHVFDVGMANKGTLLTAQGLISQYCRSGDDCSVGIIGDSITDGAWTTSWSPNPINAAGNLSSTNYNHNLNGGNQSWFRVFTDNLNTISGTTAIKAYNCASSGKKLFDGWGYRNFDYGFFQNKAYGNKAPKVLFVAMGVNDNGDIWKTGYDEYFIRFEQIIRKAWGYGSAICFVSLNSNNVNWALLEGVVKQRLEREFLKVEYIDLSKTVLDMYTDGQSYSVADVAKRPNGVLDITHFSTIGHRYVGAQAAVNVLDSQVIQARENLNVIPSVNTVVTIKGYPSNNLYQVTLEALTGSDYLSRLGAWGAATVSNENVTVRYYINVRDNDIDLSIFEPLNPTYTTSGRGNTFRCYLNSDSTAAYITGKLASNGKTSNTKLVTRAGKLKKGLNIIDVIYDGSPSKVYPPALILRKSSESFSTGVVNVPLGANEIKGLTGFSTAENDLTLNYSLSNVNDEAPDMTNGSTANQVNVAVIETMPVGAVVLFNYKKNLGSGCGVGRSASGSLSFYTMTNGVLTPVNTVTADLSGRVRITKAGDNIQVRTTSGANTNFDLAGCSGGKMSVMNNSSASFTLVIESVFSRLV